MKSEPIFQSLRSCRDRIKGRQFASSEHDLTFADIRCRIRNSYPPLSGDRLRRSMLGTIGILAIITTLFVCLAA